MLSSIERSKYIESNNLGRKSCPVSGIERIRYSGCFITFKIEGENSGLTKSSGFMVIPVLRWSGLEGFLLYWQTLQSAGSDMWQIKNCNCNWWRKWGWYPNTPLFSFFRVCECCLLSLKVVLLVHLGQFLNLDGQTQISFVNTWRTIWNHFFQHVMRITLF